MTADDRLIVALDVPDALAGMALAQKLGDAVSFYKIGLGMLTGGGLADALAAVPGAFPVRCRQADERRRILGRFHSA